MPSAERASHEFALGDGDIVDAAEFSGVGGSDAEDDADLRPDHVREVLDVADARGAHLDDEAGVEVGLKTVRGTPTSPL